MRSKAGAYLTESQVFRLCEEPRDEAIHLFFTPLDCRVGFKGRLLAMTIQAGWRWR
jgi:hypothetical protein